MQKDVQGTSLLILALLASFATGISGCVVTPQYQDQVSAPETYVYVEAPQPLQFAEPPYLVVIPSGGVSIYMVSSMAGVYFYQGGWYRNYGGRWYQARDYNEAWVPISAAIVPQVIINVPPEYPVYLPPNYHRLHYREFHDRWRTWDRERYWQKQDWYRREALAETRRRKDVPYREGAGEEAFRRERFVKNNANRPATFSNNGNRSKSSGRISN